MTRSRTLRGKKFISTVEPYGEYYNEKFHDDYSIVHCGIEKRNGELCTQNVHSEKCPYHG